MKKDFIISIFLHIVILIGLGLSSLFFSKKIELNHINISLINGSVISPQKYKSLELTKEDLDRSNIFDKALEFNVKSNTAIVKSDNKTSNKLIETQVKDKSSDIAVTKQVKKSISNDLVKNNQATNISPPLPLNESKTSEEQKTKEFFVNNIISGLSKGKLTQLEMEALDNQLKGCWYNQGGYKHSENLKVELLLTMNPDATIKKIEVLNEDTFNTPLRRTFLDQVLRALNDPKCKQLILPAGAYDNWRIIHIIFDPKEK